MSDIDTRPALAVVVDPKPPMCWWLIWDRLHNKLWPLRSALFRRYYQINDLQGEVWELERLLTKHAALTEQLVDYLLEDKKAAVGK